MFISIISGLLVPGWSVCICSSCLHQLTNQIQTSKVSKIRAFLLGAPYWQIHSMCQWLMTAALSEWLNVTELSWIHFKLHWIKASGFKCDSVCTESQNDTELLASPSLRDSRKFWGSNLTRVRGHSSAKASVTMSLTVGVSVHYASLVCSRVCLHIFCVCFPSRAISEGQIVSNFEPNLSQRVWQEMCFFFFVKSKFCCKMHMQKFALKWLSCHK